MYYILYWQVVILVMAPMWSKTSVQLYSCYCKRIVFSVPIITISLQIVQVIPRRNDFDAPISYG